MCRPVDVLQPLWRGCTGMCTRHGQYGDRFVSKLKPAWLQTRKVDVQAYTTRAISRTSLFITKLSEYILRRYQYILVCTQDIQVCTNIHIMKYYRCTPHHGSTVEHGNQCRVSNALDEHLPHLIAWIRYWRQAVEMEAFLGITDGLIDQLNLVHTSTN